MHKYVLEPGSQLQLDYAEILKEVYLLLEGIDDNARLISIFEINFKKRYKFKEKQNVRPGILQQNAPKLC